LHWLGPKAVIAYMKVVTTFSQVNDSTLSTALCPAVLASVSSH
jgi:hypothetical protein